LVWNEGKGNAVRDGVNAIWGNSIEAKKILLYRLADGDECVGSPQHPRDNRSQERDEAGVAEFRHEEEADIVNSRDACTTCWGNEEIGPVDDIDWPDEGVDRERDPQSVPEPGEPSFAERHLSIVDARRRWAGKRGGRTPVPEDDVKVGLLG
jgi:hypothetical protein